MAERGNSSVAADLWANLDDNRYMRARERAYSYPVLFFGPNDSEAETEEKTKEMIWRLESAARDGLDLITGGKIPDE